VRENSRGELVPSCAMVGGESGEKVKSGVGISFELNRQVN